MTLLTEENSSESKSENAQVDQIQLPTPEDITEELNQAFTDGMNSRYPPDVLDLDQLRCYECKTISTFGDRYPINRDCSICNIQSNFHFHTTINELREVLERTYIENHILRSTLRQRNRELNELRNQ